MLIKFLRFEESKILTRFLGVNNYRRIEDEWGWVVQGLGTGVALPLSALSSVSLLTLGSDSDILG